jgi:murein DD-endopeptidase MepM/ murein hydrolase activator NlpD
MSKNTTSQGYIVLLISVSLLIIIQAMAIGRDSNSLERPMLSISTNFRAPEFTTASPETPFVSDHFEPGALSQLPGEDSEKTGSDSKSMEESMDSIEMSEEISDLNENSETEEMELTSTTVDPETCPDSDNALITLKNSDSQKETTSENHKSSLKQEATTMETTSINPISDSYVTYTIEKGDSLWFVANKYKTTVSKLMDWNKIAPDDSLYPGRQLHIFETAAKAIEEPQIVAQKQQTTVEPTDSSDSKKSLIYRVQKGDNLTDIAKKFHTSVANLLISNNLDDAGILRPGQALKISDAGEIIHVVNKGESLWELGKLYSIKLSKLIEHNDLKYGTIYPGQKLTIPVQSAVKLEEIYQNRKAKLLNTKFRAPLTGRLCGYYGWRIHPILKKRLFHCGVDIAAKQGKRINAIGAGEVTFAGWLKGYGKVVVVKHGGGLSSRYAHCSTINTKVGDKVKAGQTIAKVGTTGLSTGPHLHLEVRKFGHPVDPRKFVAI